MTNNNKNVLSAVVNPYAAAKKLPLVSNPYAKKPAPQNVSNAAKNKPSYNHPNPTTGIATTPKPSDAARNDGNVAVSRPNNPYANKNTKAVTPTPKKQIQQIQPNKPSSLSKGAAVSSGSYSAPKDVNAASQAADIKSRSLNVQSTANGRPSTTQIHHAPIARKMDPKLPISISSNTKNLSRHVNSVSANRSNSSVLPPSNMNRVVQQTPVTFNNKKPPMTLKQSLKSQIAQIKRRKQLLIQQREAEKIRKQREIELDKLRKQRQLDAHLLQLKQQREEVQRILHTIVSRVEQRMELEHSTGGIHYSIGETMQHMIHIIEMKDVEQKRLVREEKARLRRVKKERKMQVQQCLLDIVAGVERRLYSVNSQQQMHQQQHQQQQNHHHLMQVQMMMSQHQLNNHRHFIPPVMSTQQQGMVVPHCNGPYYPYNMQALSTNTTGKGYQMQHPMPTASYYHPSGLLPHTQHPYIMLPSSSKTINVATSTTITAAATKPAAAVAATTTAANKPLILSSQVLSNPHSPYLSSHQMVDGHVCVMKKDAKDSFGVTLRYESKSLLVACVEEVKEGPNNVVAALSTTVIGGVSTTSTTTTTHTPTTEKKPRRKRETYGVLAIVEASKARFAEPNERKLQPGDVILSINARNVGGMTFTEACQFISTSSERCAVTGEIRCVLTVARRKVPLSSAVVGAAVNSTDRHLLHHPPTSVMPTAPIISLIPFSIFGEKVMGDFTSSEWCALIRSFPTVSRSMGTGMALLPVSCRDICAAIKREDIYSNFLSQRNVESMEAKMAYEGKRIDEEAKQKADEYWRAVWEGEVKDDANNENNSLVENFLTDAQRSVLRSKARPTSGCKCGSQTHTFVNDPKCVLYRNVKQFCAQNFIDIEEEKKVKGKKISTKGKGKLQAAYIRRFNQLRAETAATKEEAEFVLKMEQNQCFGLKQAVFAPSSLCTVVLSAVAAVMDLIPTESLLDSEKPDKADEMDIEAKPIVVEPDKSLHSDEDDSDDEDMPLNALLKPQASLKRVAGKSNLPSPKRPKQIETSCENSKSKAVPSNYILGEILNHISKTYGHLYREPSHPNYAWQQRHRSVITTPLPKEVMFKGNPRKPGTLSFENIRFVVTEELLARLKNNWLNPDQLNLPPQSTEGEMEKWNDEWTITYLSSDAVTGVAHEIDVLENLGILTIHKNGSIVFTQGWERRVPHMTLKEMNDAWGSEMYANNLYCIHEKVISSLEDVWEHDEDGWRFESDDLNDDDDDDFLVFEDEEYEMRRQIFLENYDAFVNATKGIGEFGI